MRILLINGMCAIFVLISCKPDQQQPVHMTTVYKRHLEFPIPQDVEARTNPPVLRWPPVKGKQVRYDVRMSSDADFSVQKNIFEAKNTPLAMFNPHHILEHGTWYWQFKVPGGEWTDIMSFVVDDSAIPMQSPLPEVFLKALPTSHPRVLANRADLADLRNLTESEDAKAIIQEAESALTIRIPVEQDGFPDQKSADKEQNRKFIQDASQQLGDAVFKMVLPLCEAYLLTGKVEYARKAIQVGLEIARWKPRGVSGISDFGDARCMLSMALVYDTFFDHLSDGEKADLLRGIQPRAEHFYNSWVNNIEVRVLSGHVWQHILHFFFQTSMALHGDVSDASDWLAYAYELFLARAPVLGGMDGGWMEGVSYFRMNMETMIDIPLYIKKYTGFDFFNTHPWYRNQTDWMIYNIPPGSAPDGFSDNTEEMNSPGIEYLAFARELAKLTGDTRAAWYAKECERYEKVQLSDKSILRWIRLAKTRDLTMPEPATNPNLTMGRVFKDIGVASLHTQPANTSENLMIAMRSSPFGSYGHMLSDQNVFNILVGGKKLFYRTGYKVTMKDPHRTGWYQHTKSQNGVLVDGQGQPYSTEAFGWISRYLEGGELAYVKGDASNAYRSEETNEDYGVTKNFRHIVLLKPDVIIIYDELEANKDVSWSWLIHSLEKMNMDTGNGTFSVALDDVEGFGRLWSSKPLSLALSDTFDVPAVNWRGSRTIDGDLKSYDDDQWHLKASNTKKVSALRFLSIIRVGHDVKEAELLSESMKDGAVELKLGEWEIRASIDDALSPGVFIQNKATGTVFASHDKSVQLGDKTFNGNYPESSKLGMMQHGKPVFLEAIDELPYDMRSRLKFYQKPNP